MNIDLPESFVMEEDGIVEAYVENGVLKIRKTSKFKKVMAQLSYEIYGNQCYYCGRKFERDDLTIDHMIPQTVGGPTITNNLVPACHECNNQKADMTVKQYMKYKKMSKDKQKEFIKKTVEPEIEKLRQTRNFSFLKGWVAMVQIDEVRTCETEFKRLNYTAQKSDRKSKYQKKEEFYEKYHRNRKAIILDRNYQIIGGFISLQVAKDNGRKTIWAIILDNVETF